MSEHPGDDAQRAAQHHPTTADELARQRTFLAAERTLFAVLRTGLAIAAGGGVIISLLGESWPPWVQVPLAAAFMIVGYFMVLHGLRRYRGIAKHVSRESGERLEIMPPRTMTALTWVLQAAITVVVILFLIGAFQ